MPPMGLQGMNTMPSFLAVLQLPPPTSGKRGGELVLHASQAAVQHPLRLVDLRHVWRWRHRPIRILPSSREVGQGTHRLGPRDRGVGPVILVEADGVHPREP